MDFEKTETICDAIIAENMDFEKESSYKGKMRIFDTNFILQNKDKIRYEFLFKYKKFYDKDREMIFELLKYFINQLENDFDNYRKRENLQYFFYKVILKEDDLIEALKLLQNKIILQIDI